MVLSKYLRNPWNYLEIINYSMLLLSLSILIMFEYVGHQRLADNLPLYFLSTVMGTADSFYAISIVLATAKVFKYLKASERFSILIGTIENAADDIDHRIVGAVVGPRIQFRLLCGIFRLPESF